jgi:hypothetical protein
MKLERYERLIKILNTGYKVDLEKIAVIKTLKGKGCGQPMKVNITNKGKTKIRIAYEGKRHEYALHEIIGTWCHMML